MHKLCDSPTPNDNLNTVTERWAVNQTKITLQCITMYRYDK